MSYVAGHRTIQLEGGVHFVIEGKWLIAFTLKSTREIELEFVKALECSDQLNL